MILDGLAAAALPLLLLLGIICFVQQFLIRNLRREIGRNNRIRFGAVLENDSSVEVKKAGEIKLPGVTQTGSLNGHTQPPTARSHS
jgi:hypothetical protein